MASLSDNIAFFSKETKKERTAPLIMAVPVTKNPTPIEEKSPILPINAGNSPPPPRKATGIQREAARPFLPSGTIADKTAKPEGKKQTAAMGCNSKLHSKKYY
jgi:hypothetical protein